ncbi:MAG: NosD domain-containing protein, partial [Candidatus Bathyarchaeia archaeon]
MQNVDTGKFYDSIVEAVYDPETLDGHTIKAGEGVYFEHVIVNKSITLAGENRETTVIDGNGTGTILKITVPNVTILNFTIRNAVATGDYGLHLDNSNSSMLENIIIRNCHMGIILFWSYKNQISSLDVKNANVGVLMDHSSENHISQSNVSQCITGIKIETQSVNNTMETVNINECTYGLGLGVFANYNALKRSNITLCSHAALTFDRSGYCTFIGNTFFANNHIIEIIGPLSDNNTFAFNNFLSNTAIFSSIEPKNIWNLDYPIGGNFWSSYTGKDEQSGIYQNETGSDGIGDIPHIIGLNNVDKYPLAGAFWNFSATEQNQVLIISNSTISNFQY